MAFLKADDASLTQDLPCRPPSSDVSVYIHWPYCRHRCPYCAFNTYVSQRPPDINKWQQAFVTHLRWWSEKTGSTPLSTIFLGGGTPSLMPPELMATLIAECQRLWPAEHAAEPLEVTAEINPTSASTNTLQGLRSAGVNRASIGVQSLNDEHLAFLGRDHTAHQARDTVLAAQEIFDSVSIDLIYALPDQSSSQWHQELEGALSVLKPDHVSPYQLTIEDGTPFAQSVQRQEWQPLPSGMEADLYDITCRTLEAQGLRRYEVSNFAHPGRECRHNLRYWQGETVLGIGPGAHGRWYARNSSDTLTPAASVYRTPNETNGHAPLVTASVGHRWPQRWLDDILVHGNGLAELRTLTADETLDEMVLTSLRTIDGLPRHRLATQTSPKAAQVWERAQQLEKSGDLTINRHTIRATHQGMLRLNSVTGFLLA